MRKFYKLSNNELFYTFSGENSGFPDTALPFFGIDLLGNFIKPTLVRSMVNNISTMSNVYTSTLVNLFGKNVCENFFKLINVTFNEKLSLEKMLNSTYQYNIDKLDLDEELNEQENLNYLDLLTRFKDLNCMIISYAIGGGFWINPANAQFTTWFKDTFHNKINEARININMNRNYQATQYLTHTELKKMFPEAKYREITPTILEPFIRDSQYLNLLNLYF